MTETPEQKPLDLHYLASRLDAATIDLILVEGFKHEPINKIALYREAVGKPYTDLIDEYVIALASDELIETAVEQLDINQPEQIADFICSWLQINPSQP